MHSDSRSTGAEWLTSPRLSMPTIRLLLLITGNLRTFSSSMCRTALARSSSSRQQWISAVITSRAVALRASKSSCANPLHTMSRSVTIFANRDGAYVMVSHQFCELGHRGVWTDPIHAFVHRLFDFHGGPPLLDFERT